MKILCVLATIIAVVIVPMTAQAQDQLQFRVNIPFEFVAGGVHMGAGNYLAFHVTPMILNFVREDGKGSAWVKVIPSPVATNDGTNQIVFTKYGDTYFLSKVHTGHDHQMHDCLRCPEEKNLMAWNSGKPTKIVLPVLN